jgi:hypothetical protein
MFSPDVFPGCIVLTLLSQRSVSQLFCLNCPVLAVTF